MAVVTFCGALVEAMRTRMSLSEAIRSLLLFLITGLRRFSDASGKWPGKPGHHHQGSSKCLGEAVPRALALGSGSVGQLAAIANGVEKVDLLATQQRHQAVLEGANLSDRERVEISVSTGPDHGDLLFHLQRRELRLLQKLG